MLKAIIFDCDGVIADSEPLHMACLQQVLAEEGITLTEEIYYRDYLAFDDRNAFTRAFRDHARRLTGDKLQELIAHKAARLEPVMRMHLKIFPGVAEFIRLAAAKLPLAVASGALGHEIELILEYAGVRDCFQTVVSAEDVTRGKPDPESFKKAYAALNGLNDGAIALPDKHGYLGTMENFSTPPIQVRSGRNLHNFRAAVTARDGWV